MSSHTTKQFDILNQFNFIVFIVSTFLWNAQLIVLGKWWTSYFVHCTFLLILFELAFRKSFIDITILLEIISYVIWLCAVQYVRAFGMRKFSIFKIEWNIFQFHEIRRDRFFLPAAASSSSSSFFRSYHFYFISFFVCWKWYCSLLMKFVSPTIRFEQIKLI